MEAQQGAWLRAYLVVAVLALVLIPAGALVARIATGSTASAMKGMGFEVDNLDATTKFFVTLGSAGYVIVGGVSLAVIAGMACKRHYKIGTIVSAMVLVACLGFFLLAELHSHIPFGRIIWRLTG
jgi:hypothetical protein